MSDTMFDQMTKESYLPAMQSVNGKDWTFRINAADTPGTEYNIMFEHLGIEIDTVGNEEQTIAVGSITANPDDISSYSVDSIWLDGAVIWPVRLIITITPLLVFEIITADLRYIDGIRNKKQDI